MLTLPRDDHLVAVKHDCCERVEGQVSALVLVKLGETSVANLVVQQRKESCLLLVEQRLVGVAVVASWCHQKLGQWIIRELVQKLRLYVAECVLIAGVSFATSFWHMAVAHVRGSNSHKVLDLGLQVASFHDIPSHQTSLAEADDVDLWLIVEGRVLDEPLASCLGLSLDAPLKLGLVTLNVRLHFQVDQCSEGLVVWSVASGFHAAEDDNRRMALLLHVDGRNCERSDQ